MADNSRLTILDRIEGSSFLIIRSAVPVFQRRKLDVQFYKIGLFQENESIVTLFSRINDQNEAMPKNVGIRKGSDSDLNSGDLRLFLSKLNQLKTLDKIQGKSYLAIDAADAVFQQRHQADLAAYRITLVRERDSVYVTFADKDGKPDARGGPGSLPAFEVELTAGDLKVLRSHFVR